MHAIVSGLDQWRGEDEPHPTAASDNDIKEDFQHQSKLGWDCALKGILTKKWAEIQHQYFLCLSLRRTGKRFISALIKKLWDTSWDFWQHRNNHLACGEADAITELLLQLHT
eukprot:1735973-Ditylum_brightwellii.AAC.1